MPKYTNGDGVTISVSESEAGSLTRDWVPLTPAPEPAEPPVDPERHDDAHDEARPVESTGADGEHGGEPAGNASRGEWAAYAKSLGIEPGEMTRNELRDAVAGH